MTVPGIICPEPPQLCELCGAFAETRPLGPNCEEVCFQCMLKDEETAKKRYKAFMEGNAPPRGQKLQ
jgi:hypothetical protein